MSASDNDADFQESAIACTSADARFQESFNFDGLVRNGNVSLQAKDFEQAIAYYYRALRLQPGSIAVRLTLRLALRQLGRNDEAEHVLKTAIKMHSDRKEPFMFTHSSSLLL